MRLILKFAVAALVISTAIPAAVAQDVVLKVHHFWPPGAMPPSTILAPRCDKIAKDSGNKMKCQVYPAMQLGGTPQNLIDQAKDGVGDIVWTLPGYTAGPLSADGGVRASMSSSAEATSQAVWDYYTQFGHKEFPGIKALAPPARKLAVDHGNTFYVIPASELANWQQATANLPEEWVKDVSANGNDGAALLKSARDLIAKYEKK